MDIRRQMMSADRKLPKEYRECRYIQTVGTAAFFDTGISGDDDTIQIDFTVMPMARGNYAGGILGNHDTEDEKCWRIIQGATANNNRWTVTANNRQGRSSSSIIITHLDTILYHVFYIHMEYGYVYVEQSGNNTRYSVSPVTTANATSTLNIFIGANGPNKTQSATAPSHRFYGHIKIKKQGKLIRDYLTCVRKSDGKPGFYDLINRTFNVSIGNRDFTASAD